MEKYVLQNILKSVSRSFYLSLRILPSSVRAPMGLGYLFCRAADTITDTDCIEAAERKPTLRKMRDLFSSFPLKKIDIEELSEYLRNINGLPGTSDGRLLNSFSECGKVFFSLPHTDQSLIQNVVLAVIKGMEIDLEFFTNSKEIKAFPDNEALETYIGHIGGDPGIFWTGLLLHHIPSLREAPRDDLQKLGHRFGTGLQMVNILKDLPKDLPRGRCYIPESDLKEAGLSATTLLDAPDTDFLPVYHKHIDQTIDRLHAGLSYLTHLPRFSFSLRAPVWWPLAFGLKTLIQLRNRPSGLRNIKGKKISRGDVYRTMAESLFYLPFGNALEGKFNDWAGAASSSLLWQAPEIQEGK